MFVEGDGLAVGGGAPGGRPRRGASLSDDQVRLWNDALYVFLQDCGELSPADAHRVLSRPIGPSGRRMRDAGVRPLIQEYGFGTVFGGLIRAAAGDLFSETHGAGDGPPA